MRDDDHVVYIMSINGWITVIFLTIVVFTIYYLWLYPVLYGAYEQGFWKYSDMDEDWSCELYEEIDQIKCEKKHIENVIAYSVRVPLFLADFVDREIDLRVENLSNTRQKGTLRIKSQLVASTQNTVLKKYPLVIETKSNSGNFEKAEYISWELEAHSAYTYQIRVRMPYIDRAGLGEKGTTYARLVFYNITPIATSDKEYRLFTATHSADENIDDEILKKPVPLPWSNNLKNANCHVGSYENGYRTQICMEVDPPGAFRHSAIENLLFPPWANGLLPLIVIIVVLLVERILPRAGLEIYGNPTQIKTSAIKHQELTIESVDGTTKQREEPLSPSIFRSLSIALLSILFLIILIWVLSKTLFADNPPKEFTLFIFSVILFTFIFSKADKQELDDGYQLVEFLISLLLFFGGFFFFKWLINPLVDPSKGLITTFFDDMEGIYPSSKPNPLKAFWALFSVSWLWAGVLVIIAAPMINRLVRWFVQEKCRPVLEWIARLFSQKSITKLLITLLTTLYAYFQARKPNYSGGKANSWRKNFTDVFNELEIRFPKTLVQFCRWLSDLISRNIRNQQDQLTENYRALDELVKSDPSDTWKEKMDKYKQLEEIEKKIIGRDAGGENGK